MKPVKASLHKRAFLLILILSLALIFGSAHQVLAVRLTYESVEQDPGYDEIWIEEEGVTVDPGCTLDPDATFPAQLPVEVRDEGGNQCLKAHVLDNTDNNDAYAYQNKDDPQADSYVRGYLYVDDEGFINGEVLTTLALYDADNEPVAGFQIGKASGVLKLRFVYYSSGLKYTSSTTILPDTWYRLEYEYDTTNHSWETRVQGGTPVAGSLLNTRAPQQMRIGVTDYRGTAGDCTLYTDLAVWNDLQDTTHYVDGDNDNAMYPFDTKGTAAPFISTAVNVWENARTIKVKKATGQYLPMGEMKSNMDVIGTNENWDPPTALDYSDCPTVSGGPNVTFKGPLDNCTVKGFKFVVGGQYGQIFINGEQNAGPVTNVTIQDCWLFEPQNCGICVLGVVSFTLDHCDIDGSGMAGIVGPGPAGGLTLNPVSDAGSPIVIRNNTHIHGSGMAGIALIGDGTPEITIQDSQIYDSYEGGIRLDSFELATIDKNGIYNNGKSGTRRAGIRIEDVDSATITDNDIDKNGKAGVVFIGDNQDVTVSGNHICGNYAGIYFKLNDTGDLATGDYVIRENYIYKNRGASYEGGGIQLGTPGKVNITISQNDIAQNELGGIGIKGVSDEFGQTCTLAITKNNIYDNVKGGGIHTGDETGTCSGRADNADFTIKQNKVHRHRNAYHGGGIDVRHARGTIENNLVYKNSRGGIRCGNGTAIRHNTVVNNGTSIQERGGGIVFDDLAGSINDPPSGAPSESFPIKNNISAYNVRTGIRACFYETEDIYGDKYRDYNLLYSNNQDFLSDWCTDCASPDCSTGDTRDQKKCRGAQLGRGCAGETTFCCTAIGATGALPGETLIFADPLFKDMANHDYRLQRVSEGDAGDSPAIGAGADGVDMGAYGGPGAINDDDFPPIVYGHCLIDDDITTGNTPAGGTCVFLDLGASDTITHVRLYRPTNSPATTWDVYVGDTLTDCVAGEYIRDGTLWAAGWNIAPLTDASGRYIKLVASAELPEDAVSEINYSTDGGSSWKVPVSTVVDCTDIYGLCE